MKTFTVATLDVWGNEYDGWDINNYFTWRKDVTEEELHDINAFLKEHCKGKPEDYEIYDSHSGFIEVTVAKTGEPVLHITENIEEE